MATVLERLIQLAKETDGVHAFDVAAVEKPDWDAGSKCHNWRNHVSTDLTELWPLLSLEAKLVAFLYAAEDAHREEWE